MPRYKLWQLKSFRTCGHLKGAGRVCLLRWQKVQVDWVPPWTWCFKLDIESSLMGNKKSTNVGGIIKDQEGVWIKGFSSSGEYVIWKG